jgi:hypothetical protein
MPFQKGQIANPHGRPLAGAGLSDALRRMLDIQVNIEPGPAELMQMTNKEYIAYLLIKKAKDSDMMAIKEIFDRTEGRAVQKQILVGEEGAPGILIEFSSNGQGKIQPNAKTEPGNGDDAGSSA